ncbi:MAG: hypothetical protein ACFB8W_22325 [Elainellaceae cyanobacterium]
MRYFLSQRLQVSARWIMVICVTGLVWFTSGLAQVAQAQEVQSPAIVATDEAVSAAVVECFPKKLSDGNLDRALEESRNDFLERVFLLKPVQEYKLSQAESEFLSCLKSKGVTPQIEQQNS